MRHERRCCRGGNDLLMINPPSLFGTSQMRAAMILPEGLGPSPSNLDEESKVISSLSSKAFTFKIKQYFLYFFFLLCKWRGEGGGFPCSPWEGPTREQVFSKGFVIHGEEPWLRRGKVWAKEQQRGAAVDWSQPPFPIPSTTQGWCGAWGEGVGKVLF